VVCGLERRKRSAPRQSIRIAKEGQSLQRKDASGDRRKKIHSAGHIASHIDRWLQAHPQHDYQHTGKEIRAAIGHLKPGQLRAEPMLGILARWKSHYARSTALKRWKITAMILRALRIEGAPALDLPKLPPQRARKRVADQEEIAAMLRAADPPVRLFLLFTATLGLRYSEAISIAPANYSAERHTITFKKKGGDEHTLPTSEQIEELFAIAPDRGDPNESYISRLLPQRSGEVKTRIRRLWAATRKRAGVPADLWPHDLRRTAAVSLYEITKDIRAVQQLLGHQSLTTTAWYLQHADTEKMRALLHEMWRPPAKHVQ